ncbi:MAG TPA: serine/threonine-protein kinase [Kofleriaceae bacterium]|nr:serine/threonine-protein kinase [Kofleriaceae bacterium]
MISHLATGGMAQIYLARIAGAGAFERHVVLKTILPERASDHRFVTMFLDEAKLAATLNHQNIAQVYDVDQSDGNYFMAMEYVHGENVRAILETSLRRNWQIPNELAMHIVGGAAAGLHHAHERKGRNGQPLNIVHRDVSPANIMVGFDGSVKVLDFGIAKAEERSTKTVGNTIKGKYGYMSPEQCKGAGIDRRSDIFALGIVLYELTTLRRAFKGQDDFDTMKRIVGGELARPSRVVQGYPLELESIVMTALAVKPEQRFQSAHELLEAIDAYANRAKISGGASAMARFMGQLFGDKKEPWVDEAVASRANGALGNDDKTRVGDSVAATSARNEEKTQVLGGAVNASSTIELDPGASAISTSAWRATPNGDDQEQDAKSWATYDSTTAQRHDVRARASAPRITPPPPMAQPMAPPPSAPITPRVAPVSSVPPFQPIPNVGGPMSASQELRRTVQGAGVNRAPSFPSMSSYGGATGERRALTPAHGIPISNAPARLPNVAPKSSRRALYLTLVIVVAAAAAAALAILTS